MSDSKSQEFFLRTFRWTDPPRSSSVARRAISCRKVFLMACLPRPPSSKIVDRLFHNLNCHFGAPTRVVRDNSREFRSVSVADIEALIADAIKEQHAILRRAGEDADAP